MKLHALSSLLLTAPPLASAIDNGVARTPALGWSSWNYFVSTTDPHPQATQPAPLTTLLALAQEDDINETLIEGIAQGMVSSGLRDAGYVPPPDPTQTPTSFPGRPSRCCGCVLRSTSTSTRGRGRRSAARAARS